MEFFLQYSGEIVLSTSLEYLAPVFRHDDVVFKINLLLVVSSTVANSLCYGTVAIARVENVSPAER